MTSVNITAVNKSFGTQHVLRGVSLDIQEGEFIVLLGSSGCGKSTLMNVIAGLELPDTGTIQAGGHDITTAEPADRGMAMVFQSYALYPTMSVRKNLSFGLRVARMPKAEIEARTTWAAKLLQIEQLLDRKPSQLSGGQRQRVAIGRALVRRSPICLFDEPLSNLDAKLRNEMRLEIKRLHQTLGSTMIYVTHDQIEAMTLATRVAVMNAGQVEQFATPDELYERPQTLFVAGFVGSPSMNLLSATLRVTGGRVMAELAQGVEADLTGYPFKAAPVEGARVVLGLRPENLGFSGPAHVAATVTVVEGLGADALVWCELAGQTVSMRVPSVASRGIGGTVDLHYDPAFASVFDAQTQQRL